MRLVAELVHPVELAQRGDPAQQPAQLGVLGHVALAEEDAARPGPAPRRAGWRACRRGARAGRPGRRAPSARGGRRCSRSPRRAPGPRRSGGSRRCSCPGACVPWAGCRRRCALGVLNIARAPSPADLGGLGGMATEAVWPETALSPKARPGGLGRSTAYDRGAAVCFPAHSVAKPPIGATVRRDCQRADKSVSPGDVARADVPLRVAPEGVRALRQARLRPRLRRPERGLGVAARRRARGLTGATTTTRSARPRRCRSASRPSRWPNSWPRRRSTPGSASRSWRSPTRDAGRRARGCATSRASC